MPAARFVAPGAASAARLVRRRVLRTERASTHHVHDPAPPVAEPAKSRPPTSGRSRTCRWPWVPAQRLSQALLPTLRRRPAEDTARPSTSSSRTATEAPSRASLRASGRSVKQRSRSAVTSPMARSRFEVMLRPWIRYVVTGAVTRANRQPRFARRNHISQSAAKLRLVSKPPSALTAVRRNIMAEGVATMFVRRR